MSAASPDVLEHSARRIEQWLLESGVQLTDGPHRGGIAGWLDEDGRPEFVYLEITGYYLTTMAWLAEGGASSAERVRAALDCGRRALEWLESATAGGAIPPTRLYLASSSDDWRNAAVFSFDLAMAARGVACFDAVAPSEGAAPLIRELGARVLEISAGAGALKSHALRNGQVAAMPDRWSTRSGPHHIKTAAALLALPRDSIDPRLARACEQTAVEQTSRLQPPWPGLHALLYGLEGLVILDQSPSSELLDVVERVYQDLIGQQAADGSLPAEFSGGTAVRSDVLAQALRVGALLQAAGRLRSGDWRTRLDGLASALLEYVRDDGGVVFSADHQVANAWSAMFAHQALLLHARQTGDLTHAALTRLV